jgi:hypothetical protein
MFWAHQALSQILNIIAVQKNLIRFQKFQIVTQPLAIFIFPKPFI